MSRVLTILAMILLGGICFGQELKQQKKQDGPTVVQKIRALERKIDLLDLHIRRVHIPQETEEAKEYARRLKEIRNAPPSAKVLKSLPRDHAE